MPAYHSTAAGSSTLGAGAVGFAGAALTPEGAGPGGLAAGVARAGALAGESTDGFVAPGVDAASGDLPGGEGAPAPAPTPGAGAGAPGRGGAAPPGLGGPPAGRGAAAGEGRGGNPPTGRGTPPADAPPGGAAGASVDGARPEPPSVADGDALAGASSGALSGSPCPARTSIRWPHLRHFIRTVLPATLSSAIWYFALQLSHRNFMGLRACRATLLRAYNPVAFLSGDRKLSRDGAARWAQSKLTRWRLIDSRVSSSGAARRARSHDSIALWRKPAFW